MARRRLTVMHLTSGDGRGGSDRIALDIARAMSRRGHRVIWGSPAWCCLIGAAQEAGVEYFDLYPSGRLDMTVLPEFIRFCKDERVDVVDAHHSHSRHIVVSGRLRGLRTKTVVSRHCVLDTFPLLGAFHYNILVDMNIAVSVCVRESLLRGGILPSHAALIYGGIEVTAFEDVPATRVEEMRRQYTRPGSLTIGMVARLQHARHFDPDGPTLKGHEVLFRAVRSLGRDSTVLLLGPWEDHDYVKLRRIAERCGLGPQQLVFGGYQEDMAPFYRVMDVNVLPSPREGLGLSMIEGMAAGTPCVGAASGGIAEIITDRQDGLLFPPGESGALGSAIAAVADDSELREKIIAGGRLTARERFGMARVVDETEELFYRLAG